MKTIVRLLVSLGCLFAMTLAHGASFIEGVTANVNESNGTAVVTLQRTGDLDTTVSVDYFTADFSATNGTDYVATNGTVTFTAGVATLPVTITLINDAMPESGEFFYLYLTNATGGATLSAFQPRVIITDNDSGIQVQSQYYTNREDAGSVTVTVTRGVDENFPATVAFYTQNSSAKAGTDYVSTNGTLEFAVGEFAKTVTIIILNDALPEATEIFLFRLGTVTGATALGTPNTASVQILDNDSGIQLEKTTYWVRYDAGAVTIGVTAGAELSAPATVDFYTTNKTAMAGTDYMATNGTLTFAPGQLYQTVTIPILDDGVFTTNKSFEFRLGAVTGPIALGTNKIATINIKETTTMTLTGNPADYVIAEGNPPSILWQYTTSGDIGANTTGRNVVFVFELPVLEASAHVLSARLSFRLSGITGVPTFNGDLWGIGFQTNGWLLAEYFEAQENDPGNAKLQNHILTPGMAVGTYVASATNSGLADYLQSFYNNNPTYAGGVYVLLRVNPDADPGNGTVRYTVDLAESTTPPTLTITASDPGPMIYRTSPSYSASPGGTVIMQTLATGGVPPLTYQWWFDGTAIPGATNNILVLSNVQPANVGNYLAVVGDGVGFWATSRLMSLALDPTFTRITQGDIAVDSTNLWGGPCWVDFDDDGWLELVIFGDFGTRFAVYENNRDGTFTRIHTNGLANTTLGGNTLAWGDYDNDGNLDCFAGGWGSVSSYYRNDGNGQFTRFAVDRTWTANAMDVLAYFGASADYDGDGLLDIATAYWGSSSNLLLHNVGGGHFEVLRNSSLANAGLYIETIAWADYDNNGYPELFYSSSGNSTTLETLFQNQGGSNFVQVTNGPLVQTPSMAIGASWADFDNDGKFDIAVCNWGNVNFLFRNQGSNVFEPVVNGPFNNGNICEQCMWGDYDNDGYLDLFVAYWNQKNRLFHNNGDGSFAEIFTGSPVNESTGQCWAGCWGDYDNDGFLDLIVVENPGRNLLYRNSLPQTGNTNHWLKVKLTGTISNRSAIGAKVRVKATIGGKTFWQMRQVASSSWPSELLPHFGLGDAANVDIVRIEWPSGVVQELTNVVANQFLTVTEACQPCLGGGCFTNGAFVLSLETELHRAHAVEFSSDLKTWQVLTNIPMGTHTFQFQDSTAAGTQRRFYRVVAP
jgi:hypothetical protein